MKNDPLEKVIEKKVCDFAKSQGFLVYKFTSPSRRSVPDRMFVSPQGRVMFIEFKRLGMKPSMAQGIEIDRLRKQGVAVEVVDSVESGKRVLTNWAMEGM